MTRSSKKPDYIFLVLIVILVLIGLLMLASASSVIGFEKFQNSNYFLQHQILNGVLIGGLLLFVLSKIDYRIWRKWAFLLLAFNILLLIAVLLPGIGYEYGGARRWIQVGSVIFQPSEFLKLTLIIYLAAFFEKSQAHKKETGYGFLPFLMMVGIIIVLIMFQPDMGTMFTISLIALAIYFTAGAPFRLLAVIITGAVGVFALLIHIAPYRVERLTVFLNPALDPQGIGYHVNQALLAIGSGGIFGLGLGHSRQKFLYLPEVTGDSIFAIIAEELGLILSAGLIILFVAIMYRGLRIARSAPDTFAKLLTVGVIVWFVLQAFVNIGAMVGLLPLTGIPLPFISYGSSALIASLAAVGIILNISRQRKT